AVSGGATLVRGGAALGARNGRARAPRRTPTSAEEVPGDEADHVARALRELAHDRRLEAGVHRAVLAEPVLARLPVLPVCPVPEVGPRGGVRLPDQVAGTLPAERRVGDRAPGRAPVVAEPSRELEEHRRGREPVLARDLEDAPELLLDLVPGEEDVAV